jgi:hypothetical protein
VMSRGSPARSRELARRPLNGATSISSPSRLIACQTPLEAVTVFRVPADRKTGGHDAGHQPVIELSARESSVGGREPTRSDIVPYEPAVRANSGRSSVPSPMGGGQGQPGIDPGRSRDRTSCTTAIGLGSSTRVAADRTNLGAQRCCRIPGHPSRSQYATLLPGEAAIVTAHIEDHLCLTLAVRTVRMNRTARTVNISSHLWASVQQADDLRICAPKRPCCPDEIRTCREDRSWCGIPEWHCRTWPSSSPGISDTRS